MDVLSNFALYESGVCSSNVFDLYEMIFGVLFEMNGNIVTLQS